MAEDKTNIIKIKVSDISPNPWNPNKQSDFMYQKELNSIKKFGFLIPLVVRKTKKGYQLIDGEHRWKAVQELGFKEISCNNLGDVPDHIAKQLTWILNETKGKPEQGLLAELIQKLEKEVPKEELLEVLPVTDTEFDALMSTGGMDWDDIKSKGVENPNPEYDEDWIKLEYKVPESVGDSFKSQIKRLQDALHPDDKPKDRSPVQAIEAMTQHIAQIPDNQLI